MYFGPSKKTYYRFPSLSKVQDFDSRHYYPNRPYTSGENIRFEAEFTDQEQYQNTQDTYYDIRYDISKQ